MVEIGHLFRLWLPIFGWKKAYLNCTISDSSLFLKKAKNFFHHCILPELLSKWYSRKHSIAVPTIATESRPADDEDDGSWCYCKEDRAGEMIACDDRACPNTWYHLACLKFPTRKWVCPTCHASSYNLKRSAMNINNIIVKGLKRPKLVLLNLFRVSDILYHNYVTMNNFYNNITTHVWVYTHQDNNFYIVYILDINNIITPIIQKEQYPRAGCVMHSMHTLTNESSTTCPSFRGCT